MKKKTARPEPQKEPNKGRQKTKEKMKNHTPV
jgi:hypothetical protein